VRKQLTKLWHCTWVFFLFKHSFNPINLIFKLFIKDNMLCILKQTYQLLELWMLDNGCILDYMNNTPSFPLHIFQIFAKNSMASNLTNRLHTIIMQHNKWLNLIWVRNGLANLKYIVCQQLVIRVNIEMLNFNHFIIDNFSFRIIVFACIDDLLLFNIFLQWSLHSFEYLHKI